MHNSTITDTSTTQGAARRGPLNRPWRVVDIVVASVLGVASGVIFWAWGLAWPSLSAVLAFTPGLEGLLAGGWLFAGVLGGLVIRKPGAALYTEIVAGVVSMLIGTQWGFPTFIWAVIEGLGAELVFAIFLYRSWRVGVALISGAGAGVAVGLLDTLFTSFAGLAFEFKLVYLFSAIVSGAIIAGLLPWLATRALAKTGALSRFASGREARIVDDAPAAAQGSKTQTADDSAL